MRTFVCSIVILLFACTAFAQTETPDAEETARLGESVSELLDWMNGKWEGEGSSSGDQEFLARMTAGPELDGEAVVVHRESIPTAGSVSGKKEIMVIGVDGSTKKIIMTLTTSNNFIGIYTGELKDQEIVFDWVTAPEGYVSRRSFRLLPDGGLSFVIEQATPGKQVSKQVEINFRKTG